MTFDNGWAKPIILMFIDITRDCAGDWQKQKKAIWQKPFLFIEMLPMPQSFSPLP
jgi:hypothetical protein